MQNNTFHFTFCTISKGVNCALAKLLRFIDRPTPGIISPAPFSLVQQTLVAIDCATHPRSYQQKKHKHQTSDVHDAEDTVKRPEVPFLSPVERGSAKRNVW